MHGPAVAVAEAMVATAVVTAVVVAVTDETLGWAGESRNGFLCTCEGVEFLEYIKNIIFSFSIVFFFSTFRMFTTEFKFA